ncbi:MAG: hypothetical protein COB69_04415 [Phycisphaera sp.]|nr:MAG: hypothetical protein COB69_04415 [Phycisphaera sp.]
MAQTTYETESGAKVFGLLAEFANPYTLTEGAKKVRDAGYKKWDTHSPFAVHEMEESMGIEGKAIAPMMMVIGLAAVFGASGGYFMQWIINYDYSIVVQGKPTYQAWEPFIPITFEMGILCTAFASLLGMLAFNGLPRHHHPLFSSDEFLRVSDDAFFLSIEAADAKFDPDETRKLLTEAGATNIELIQE